HHVGLQLLGQLDGFAAIARLADDLHIALQRQDEPETLAHHRVIISQQDTDHRRASSRSRRIGAGPASSSGTQTSIPRPSPGLVRTVMPPPALRARARIPVMPIPPATPPDAWMPRPSSEKDRQSRSPSGLR